MLCLGNFKTGTLSLHGLLGQQFRGEHEPNAYLFSRTWLKHTEGYITDEEWINFMIHRNNALKLDYECSGFLTTEASRLAKLFPQTKFVLTIRDPKSWCRSMLRHILKNRHKLGFHYWEPVLQHLFNKQTEMSKQVADNTVQAVGPYFMTNKATAMTPPIHPLFPDEESSLEEQKLYPLKGLLNYWKTSNRLAIKTIPPERLLILETKKLSESIEQLESFMGLLPGVLNANKSHLHASADLTDPLALISKNYLNEMIDPYQSVLNSWLDS
ncbi:MAG: hypothetical protein CML12_01630 [Puniceicoccaceae bacterium]|nr:hypothetical protein [Puniceicoccaceae bacterium]